MMFSDGGLTAPSAVRNLHEYCRSHVTNADVESHIIADPGYPAAVRVWTGILAGEAVSSSADDRFELTETIGVNLGCDLSDDDDAAAGLRRFRCLTSAVALVLLTREEYEYPLDLPKILWTLMSDQLVLQDALLADKILDAVAAVGEALEAQPSNYEYPVALLAELCLRIRAGGKPDVVEANAKRILDADAHLVERAGDGWFIESITNMPMALGRPAARDWRALVGELIPETSEASSLAQVRREVLGS